MAGDVTRTLVGEANRVSVPDTPSRPEPLLRPPEVARLLACSTKTVYAWAASGFLPSVRLGRLVSFRAGDVWQFVETHADNPRTRQVW